MCIRDSSKTGSSFISAAHWDISSKFGMQIVIHFLEQVPSLNLNPEVNFWLYGHHLVKSIWRYNPAMHRLIVTKFGRLKQNHMLRSKHRSKSKSEVKFQYGGSLFSETGSSFNFCGVFIMMLWCSHFESSLGSWWPTHESWQVMLRRCKFMTF